MGDVKPLAKARARMAKAAAVATAASRAPSLVGRSYRKGPHVRRDVGPAGANLEFLDAEGSTALLEYTPDPELWAESLQTRDGVTCSRCAGFIKVECGNARAVCLLCGRSSYNPKASPRARMEQFRLDIALRPRSGECQGGSRLPAVRSKSLEQAA